MKIRTFQPVQVLKNDLMVLIKLGFLSEITINLMKGSEFYFTPNS